MLAQILDALNCVHTHNLPVIYRDIKPANILFHRHSFCVTNFGIAKVVDASSTQIGTQWYAAPEIIQLDGEQTPMVCRPILVRHHLAQNPRTRGQ